MNWDLQYGELSKDTEFVNKCENLKEHLTNLQSVLDKLLPLKERYDELETPDKIELDLLLAFTLNSLFWINLRIQGVDTNEHPIKGELQRIKATMKKWQEVKDSDKRPTLDINAVNRFVKSGLYDHKAADLPNKKTKFTDGDE